MITGSSAPGIHAGSAKVAACIDAIVERLDPGCGADVRDSFTSSAAEVDDSRLAASLARVGMKSYDRHFRVGELDQYDYRGAARIADAFVQQIAECAPDPSSAAVAGVAGGPEFQKSPYLQRVALETLTQALPAEPNRALVYFGAEAVKQASLFRDETGVATDASRVSRVILAALEPTGQPNGALADFMVRNPSATPADAKKHFEGEVAWCRGLSPQLEDSTRLHQLEKAHEEATARSEAARARRCAADDAMERVFYVGTGGTLSTVAGAVMMSHNVFGGAIPGVSLMVAGVVAMGAAVKMYRRLAPQQDAAMSAANEASNEAQKRFWELLDHQQDQQRLHEQKAFLESVAERGQQPLALVAMAIPQDPPPDGRIVHETDGSMRIGNVVVPKRHVQQ